MSITQDQMIKMTDELESRVRARDSSQSVRLQEAAGLHGSIYIVHIENATSHDQYEVDAVTGTWVRKIIVPEPV